MEIYKYIVSFFEVPPPTNIHSTIERLNRPLCNPGSSIGAPKFETLPAAVLFLRATVTTRSPLSDPRRDKPASMFGRSNYF